MRSNSSIGISCGDISASVREAASRHSNSFCRACRYNRLICFRCAANRAASSGRPILSKNSASSGRSDCNIGERCDVCVALERTASMSSTDNAVLRRGLPAQTSTTSSQSTNKSKISPPELNAVYPLRWRDDSTVRSTTLTFDSITSKPLVYESFVISGSVITGCPRSLGNDAITASRFRPNE